MVCEFAAHQSLPGGVVNPSVSFADSSLYTREPLRTEIAAFIYYNLLVQNI